MQTWKDSPGQWARAHAGARGRIAKMALKTWLPGVVGVMILVGCSSTKTVRVAVPPRVDLHAYPMIGLVTFSSNGKGDLDRASTQRFLAELQAAQPGTRVIELGTEEEVL